MRLKEAQARNRFWSDRNCFLLPKILKLQQPITYVDIFTDFFIVIKITNIEPSGSQKVKQTQIIGKKIYQRQNSKYV